MLCSSPVYWTVICHETGALDLYRRVFSCGVGAPGYTRLRHDRPAQPSRRRSARFRSHRGNGRSRLARVLRSNRICADRCRADSGRRNAVRTPRRFANDRRRRRRRLRQRRTPRPVCHHRRRFKIKCTRQSNRYRGHVSVEERIPDQQFQWLLRHQSQRAGSGRQCGCVAGNIDLPGSRFVVELHRKQLQHVKRQFDKFLPRRRLFSQSGN